MAKVRKTIGRRLDSTANLSTLVGNGPKTQTFMLASGEKAEFYPMSISADDLASQTLVDQMINIREQEALTLESLSDICATLQYQQFFPVIGRKLESGFIEILDGSRRRAAALHINKGLELLVTDKQITTSDAHHLAKAIQTAKEHSTREIGLRLQAIIEQTGINQADLAKQEGLSTAKVTRALQAANVPFGLIQLFPQPSLLAHTDYHALNALQLSEADLEALIEKVTEAKKNIDPNKPEDRYKSAVMNLIKKLSNNGEKRAKSPKPVIEPIWEFKDRNAFARRRSQDRQVSYEFNRLPKKVEKQVEAAIQSILAEHYGTEG